MRKSSHTLSLPLAYISDSHRYHRIQVESAQRQGLRNDIIRRVQPTLDRLHCDIREIGAVLDFYQVSASRLLPLQFMRILLTS